MASGTRPSDWKLGSNSSRRNRSFTPTSMGVIVRWLVTSSASSAPGSRTVRPSTTRPPRGRHYRPFHWASRRAWGRSGRSIWQYPVSSSTVSRPIRVKPTYRRACSSGQRAAGRGRSPGLRSGVSPPTAPSRKAATRCRPRSHQLCGAAGYPARVSREGA
jgi:hypothetical protein